MTKRLPAPQTPGRQPQEPNTLRAGAIHDPKTGETTIKTNLAFARAGSRAERTFSADCGRAALRNGLPELQFGQCDPFDEKKLIRSVIVRYDRRRFADRVKENLSFMEKVNSMHPDRTHGDFVAMFDKSQKEATISAVIDVEFEWLLNTGDKGIFIFMVSSGIEQHAVVSKQLDSITFRPEIEITLSVNAAMDLMDSWKKLAERIGS